MSWLDMSLVKALRHPHRTNGIINTNYQKLPFGSADYPTVSEGRYRGMADSAWYADCRERATPQRSCGARANEHVAASKPRGGDTTRRNSEIF